MAIDREAFEARPAAHRTNAEKVLAVLARNGDEAFRAAEIAERAGVDPDSANPVLARLRDRGLVEHRRPYWAIADPETVLEELAPDAIDRLDDALSELGEFADPTEWV